MRPLIQMSRAVISIATRGQLRLGRIEYTGVAKSILHCGRTGLKQNVDAIGLQTDVF